VRAPDDGTPTTTRRPGTARHSSPGGINLQALRSRAERLSRRRHHQDRQRPSQSSDRRPVALGLSHSARAQGRGLKTPLTLLPYGHTMRGRKARTSTLSPQHSANSTASWCRSSHVTSSDRTMAWWRSRSEILRQRYEGQRYPKVSSGASTMYATAAAIDAASDFLALRNMVSPTSRHARRLCRATLDLKLHRSA
jgi:hypothetical protein